MLQHFSLGLAVPDDSSPFRKVSELPLPPPSSTGEFHPTFSSETPLDNASFFPVVRRNDLPSFPDVPGPSDFRPQTTVISLDDGAGQNDACYKGVTGVGLRVTGGTHSPIVLPTLPPVRFTQSISPKVFPFLNTADSIVTPGYNFPTQLDQGTTEELRSWTQAVEFQTAGTCFF